MSSRVAVAAVLAVCLALPGCALWRELLTPSPPPDLSGPAAYDLGLLPADLGVRWPQRPQVTSEVEIGSNAQLNGEWTQSQAHLSIVGQLDQLVIDADDVEVAIDEGMYVRSLIVRPGSHRVHVHGGQLGQIVLDGPRELHPPPPEWRADDVTEDVLIEDVRVMALEPGLSGALLSGRRVALVNSRVDALYYAVYVGDTAPIQTEDLIIAGCSLRSEGESPTVSLSDVRRAAVVDTWLENPRTSTLRVHGLSDWIVTTRNTLFGGGLMMGTEVRDEISNYWFWTNTVYQAGPGLITLEPDHIRDMVLASNVLFSDAETCAWCGETPDSWVVRANRVRRYRAPPARP